MSADERDPVRTTRIGLNEAVFREVNERLRSLSDAFPSTDDALDLVCECGSASCDERIRVSRDGYESLRVDPRLFAVVPGHVEPDVEQVVEHRDGYDVLRKDDGRPARIAAATDPRRS